MYRGLFEICLGLVGFTYVLSLPTILQDLLRLTILFFRFYSKRSRLYIVLDPPNKSKRWRPVLPEHLKLLHVRHVEICKKGYVFKTVGGCSCFLKVFW